MPSLSRRRDDVFLGEVRPRTKGVVLASLSFEVVVEFVFMYWSVDVTTADLMGAAGVMGGLVEAKQLSVLILGEVVVIGELIVSREMLVTGRITGVSELLRLVVMVLLLGVSMRMGGS